MIYTKIQWATSTVNPIMGCGGCELFPPPKKIFKNLDQAIGAIVAWPTGRSRSIFKLLIEEAFSRIDTPLKGHTRALSVTNIWHLRERFVAVVASDNGGPAAEAAARAIGMSVSCYAAKLHLNKGRSIANSDRQVNGGYAPTFERITRFDGRVRSMAQAKDLLGCDDPEKPWMNGLPRLIFLSDMGDAFSRNSDFSFLETEVMDPIRSQEGSRHLWLWLTKRPDRMARFRREHRRLST